MNQNFCKKISIIDLDGTLVEGQSQVGLVKFFFQKGKINSIDAIRVFLWYILYKFRIVKDLENVFATALRSLKDRTVEEVDVLIENYIQNILSKKIYNGSYKLISDLRKEGYLILILSTAIDPLVSKVAMILGADDFICTSLEVKKGKYTGMLAGSIVYGQQKVVMLKKYFESRAYNLESARAYADHASDIPMLKIVGKAYMVNPDSHTLHLAEKEGIAIMMTNN